MSERIFLFDFDGTLTRKELLPEIGRRLGPVKEKEIQKLTEMAIRGDVPYHENLKNRIEVLKEVPNSEVREIVRSIPLFEELIRFVAENPQRCRIVTANLNVWVGDFCKSLGVQVHMSMAEEIGDKIVSVSNIIDKRSIAESYGKVVAVGDGHNDAGMLDAAEIGIACGLLHEPAGSLFQVASHVIYSEKTLCRTLRQLL